MRVRCALLFFCGLFAAPAVAEDQKPNEPPEGYVALFNGEDLAGWIGMDLDPRKLRAMTADERTQFLEKSWADVEKHWSVENGELVNDGQGPYLTTAQDYGDFELLLEYKTVAGADSGIYLRGVPQVQIWDTTEAGGKGGIGADKGSGGLFNNEKTPNSPLVHADKPFGEWNTFRITMVGDSVTVVYNDQLVVNEQPMENYWDRSAPIFPVGPIQLQTHGGEIRFRNVFLRKIDRKPPESGFLAKDGSPYGDGWKSASPVEAGKPIATAADLRNFDFHSLFQLESGKPAEIAFRSNADPNGPAFVLTVSPESGVLLSERKEGEPYTITSTPAEASGLKADGVNHLYLRAHDDHFQAWLNDKPVIDVLYPHGPQAGTVVVTGAKVESAFVRNAADDPRGETFVGGEEGFEPIFNGRDLAGWTGDVNGYAAEPFVLKSTEQGGNLFFDEELGDFAFRFEFKLDEGGNNGVGLRVPRNAGATAYEGIESQILDNTSSQYDGIQPWQAHGSIYGVLPAKRGYLASIGHWNQQEIVVEGDKFKVVLNGKTIVEGDVKEASANGTLDGNAHPGLKNEKGLLGFLGHGHVIEFRNLRLKRLGE